MRDTFPSHIAEALLEGRQVSDGYKNLDCIYFMFNCKSISEIRTLSRFPSPLAKMAFLHSCYCQSMPKFSTKALRYLGCSIDFVVQHAGRTRKTGYGFSFLFRHCRLHRSLLIARCIEGHDFIQNGNMSQSHYASFHL